jgi:hypothetical protein
VARGLEQPDGLDERLGDDAGRCLVVGEAPQGRVVRDDGEAERLPKPVRRVEDFLSGAVVEPEVLLDEQARRSCGWV